MLPSSLQNPSIILIALCMMSCGYDQAGQEVLANRDIVAEQIDPNYEPEVLDLDSVLLNRSIPFKSSVDAITEILGKPDSMVSNSHECGGFFEVDQVQNYYYGRTFFEVYGDTGVIRNIDLTDFRFTLNAGRVNLDSRTSLSDIERLFPMSASQAFPMKDEEGKKALLVRLKPKTGYDDDWVLYFQDGQLVGVKYWIPC